MTRYGQVIGLNPEKVAEYKELHAAVWPDVLKRLRDSNIRNYSIFLRQLDDGQYYLFSYLEYVGSDFAADMAKIAADTTTQRWWTFCISTWRAGARRTSMIFPPSTWPTPPFAPGWR